MRATVALFCSWFVVAVAMGCTNRHSCHEWASSLSVPVGVQRELKAMFDSRPFGTDGNWLYSGDDIATKWCPNKSYFEFLPVHVATIPLNGSATWSASCFQNIRGQLRLKPDGSGALLSLEATQPAKPDCSDWHLFTDAAANYFLDVSTQNQQRSVDIKQFGKHELRDLQQNGLQVLIMPCGILGTVVSALRTVDLFVGADLDKVNAEFLLERKVYPAFKPFGKEQAVPTSLIKSGDSLVIARLDGLDPLIMFGTGGRTGHVATAVWEGSQLYVTESTDANPFGKSYWPPPYGIIKTPWEKWIDLARKAEYNLALLPLAPALQARFNETRYWKWFRTVEGMPYGYHSMLYSFLDTHAPLRNLPQPIDNAVMTWLLTTMDRLLPNSTDGVSVYSLFTQGLNKRMGGKWCEDIPCVVDKLLTQKRTLGEVTAIPEDDTWLFDGGNFSMVCSIFSARSLLEGIGKENLPAIVGGEQTPKDLYQMAIYDKNRFNAQNCPIGLMGDPTGNGDYCQLMGKYQLPLNGYNTIPLYDGMNNRCPSQWPDFERCPKDNPKCC